MTRNNSLTTGYSPEAIELIKNTIAKGATDDELKLFLYQAKRTGLDPLTRQIYFVKRGSQVTIQTSIDGFRIIAERSGKYAGQSEPEFEDDEQGNPKKCSVSVYKFSDKGDRYEAAVGLAYFKEYKPAAGQDFMWQKMPHTMLAKVTESLALRKAFPQDLSGLYTTEEMSQSSPENHEDGKLIAPSDSEPLETPTAPQNNQNNTVTYPENPAASSKQIGMIKALLKTKLISDEKVIEMTEYLGIQNSKNMTKGEASSLIKLLLEHPLNETKSEN